MYQLVGGPITPPPPPPPRAGTGDTRLGAPPPQQSHPFVSQLNPLNRNTPFLRDTDPNHVFDASIAPSLSLQSQYTVSDPIMNPGQPQQQQHGTFATPPLTPQSVVGVGYQLDESLEVFDDELSNKSGGTSWTKRIPWMRKKGAVSPSSNDIEVPSAQSADSYLSKQLSSRHELPTSRQTLISLNRPKHRTATTTKSMTTTMTTTPPTPTRRRGLIAQTFSRMSHRSASTGSALTEEEFQDNDWTPPDSAYGAACPVCGCLPKNVRRAIEMTLIGAVSLGLIYLVVTTSIRLSNDHSGTGKTAEEDASIQLDDDYYIEYNKKTNDDGAASSSTGDDDTSDDAAVAQEDDAAAGDADASDEGNRYRMLLWDLVEDLGLAARFNMN